ncbi:MAG: pyruvate dehydrogenase E2 component (dihydrolipoamide acetyltransferase) [Oleiphilaceae bacterium]|jgi:pyruvate dehydrogenase E2 component (dihydrolipoamide acetyltransferase)
MKSLDVLVPNLGVEGAMEVIEVCVSVGEEVSQDDSIIVLESDKATVEVPCPKTGKIEAINVSVGDKILEGESVLVLFNVEGSTDNTESEIKEEESFKEEELKENKPIKDRLRKSDQSDEFVLKDIVVPDLGGAEQVEVIEISVDENQHVAEDDTILVLESDKTTMEIPSPFSGVLKKLKVKLGDKVSSGDVLAAMLCAENSSNPKENSQDSTKTTANPLPEEQPKADAKEPEREALSDPQGTSAKPEVLDVNHQVVHAGPAVRRLARELGVEIFRVKGSGPKTRILKEDLNAYIKQQVTLAQGSAQDNSTHSSGVALPSVKIPDFSSFGEVDITAMEKIQRMTAENMQTSWLTVPHVTQFDEADITDMESFRKKQKKAGEVKSVKLTPMAFLLKACGYALSQLPQFNVSIDMQAHKVYQKKYINIGIAVDTPNGLVVPVIRDVDKKGLWTLAEECQTLAAKARDRKLKPADMQGGCFTISSLGGLGGTAFTPIVNAPEVAILGVSKAQFKPRYEPDSNSFVPRLMLPLSLSYDHRAVNGADAARFTSLLSSSLGDLRALLL